MSKEKQGIGKTVKKYRLQKGISQEKLARLADLAFPTIAKIEAGATPNPSIDTVQKIAKAFGVSIDDLMK